MPAVFICKNLFAHKRCYLQSVSPDIGGENGCRCFLFYVFCARRRLAELKLTNPTKKTAAANGRFS